MDALTELRGLTNQSQTISGVVASIDPFTGMATVATSGGGVTVTPGPGVGIGDRVRATNGIAVKVAVPTAVYVV